MGRIKKKLARDRISKPNRSVTEEELSASCRLKIRRVSPYNEEEACVAGNERRGSVCRIDTKQYEEHPCVGLKLTKKKKDPWVGSEQEEQEESVSRIGSCVDRCVSPS